MTRLLGIFFFGGTGTVSKIPVLSGNVFGLGNFPGCAENLLHSWLKFVKESLVPPSKVSPPRRRPSDTKGTKSPSNPVRHPSRFVVQGAITIQTSARRGVKDGSRSPWRHPRSDTPPRKTECREVRRVSGILLHGEGVY